MTARTAWIIGATGALGSGTAWAFRRAGWSLCLASRSATRLRSLASELEAGPPAAPQGSVRVDAFDAADPARGHEFLAAWARDGGLPDACLHLAGGYAGGRGVDEWEVQQWKDMVDLNLWGPVWSLSWVFGELKRAGRGGVLIAVGAVAGIDPGKGKAPYAVAKAGLLHLIRAVAAEGIPYGIRANAVIPTILDTESNRLAMPEADRSRWTSVEDAARVLLWLASDEARTINGSLIPI